MICDGIVVGLRFGKLVGFMNPCGEFGIEMGVCSGTLVGYMVCIGVAEGNPEGLSVDATVGKLDGIVDGPS